MISKEVIYKKKSQGIVELMLLYNDVMNIFQGWVWVEARSQVPSYVEDKEKRHERTFDMALPQKKLFKRVT